MFSHEGVQCPTMLSSDHSRVVYIKGVIFCRFAVFRTTRFRVFFTGITKLFSKALVNIMFSFIRSGRRFSFQNNSRISRVSLILMNFTRFRIFPTQVGRTRRDSFILRAFRRMPLLGNQYTTYTCRLTVRWVIPNRSRPIYVRRLKRSSLLNYSFTSTNRVSQRLRIDPPSITWTTTSLEPCEAHAQRRFPRKDHSRALHSS